MIPLQWRALQTMQTIVKILTGLMARIPLSAALAFGASLGWIYGSVIRYHRRDALDALRRSYPEKTEREIQSIVNRMYKNLGMNQFEILRLAGGAVLLVWLALSVLGALLERR